MSSLKQAHALITSKPTIPIVEIFSLNGDQTTQNAIGDYSAAPVEFFVSPPPGVMWEFSAVKLEISDNGSITHDSYGGISALTNGVLFFIDRNGERTIITDPPPIKENSRLITLSTNFEIIQFGGSINSIIYELDFSLISDSVILNGNTNDKYGVILNDNFTALTAHKFAIFAETQGVRSIS